MSKPLQLFKGTTVDAYKFNQNHFTIADTPVVYSLSEQQSDQDGKRIKSWVTTQKKVEPGQILPSYKFMSEHFVHIIDYLAGTGSYFQRCKTADGRDTHMFSEKGWADYRAKLIHGYLQVNITGFEDSSGVPQDVLIEDKFGENTQDDLEVTYLQHNDLACRKIVGGVGWLSEKLTTNSMTAGSDEFIELMNQLQGSVIHQIAKTGSWLQAVFSGTPEVTEKQRKAGLDSMRQMLLPIK